MQNPLLNLSVQQLKRALEIREQIESLQAELDALVGAQAKAAPVSVKPPPKPTVPLKPKVPMPSAVPKGKWQLTPAGRAKLAALARARWRKIKALGKTHF